jgi:hypothetical protein
VVRRLEPRPGPEPAREHPGADEPAGHFLIVFFEPVGQNEARGFVGRGAERVREQGGAVVQWDTSWSERFVGSRVRSAENGIHTSSKQSRNPQVL